MDSKILNTKKAELIAAQELMLKAAMDASVKLTAAQEEQYTNHTAEINSINQTLVRLAEIEKGKKEVAAPTSEAFVPTASKNGKKVLSAAYEKAFWNALATRNFTNAALAEGGTAADGSYLVPAQTDPSIPNLALIEASARSLSRVMTTEMNIVFPYQASRGVAAAKAESTNSGTNAFATNVPTFANTTLGAYQYGDQINVSWELLQDVKALQDFVSAELNRMIVTLEEVQFVVGGTNGASSPLGYLEGGIAQSTAALTINNVLTLTGALRQAYYANAKFLANRQTIIALYKAQIASSQFQNYIQYDASGKCTLLGFPVAFSSEMPVYSASPSVSGALIFGDFSAGWVIGDRGGSGIRVKVLDQVLAANGQTAILGYKRADQRCILTEATQVMTING
ncbi:MAG TPA: phage major capsid protein [Terriglobales bacterium]|nr:phage major capsid protein [Terriglobales bacterium]